MKTNNILVLQSDLVGIDVVDMDGNVLAKMREHKEFEPDGNGSVDLVDSYYYAFEYLGGGYDRTTEFRGGSSTSRRQDALNYIVNKYL